MPPSVMQESSSAIPAQQVQSELDRVVCSTSLEHSPQLQRFLRFIVEETLAGRGSRLKEYVVGLEVFGRPTGYDPRLDSLVRVEAKRLRDALENYYAGEGKEDKIHIDFLRGSYAPSFRLAEISTTEVGAQSPKVRRSIYLWMWTSAALIGLIAIACAVVILRRQTPGVATVRTIAVLPFENLSDDPENEFLCFGLVDEITTNLAKIEHLRVIARTSSSQFSRKDDIATIASRLKADAVLEGSISRSGNHLRITAQLINAGDSLHIWAQSYDRQADDPLQIQNEVSRAVANGVAIRLGVPTGKNVLTPRYSSSALANELYWKGVYFRTQRGKEDWRKDLEKSASFLEQAIQRDQTLAPAYEVLSDVYVNLAFESNGGSITRNYVDRCRAAANRAIDLDSNSSQAHVSLAVVQAFYDWNWPAAEKSFVRALVLNPNNAKARSWYALALHPQRRFDEAIEQARMATELDPLSFQVSNILGISYYLARNNKLAMQCAQQTLQVDPRFSAAYALTGMALEQDRKYDLAIIEYQKGLAISPEHSFLQGRLGHSYAMAGRKAEAKRVLDEMLAKRDAANLSDLHIAYIYAGLQDTNAVFDQMERAYGRHDPDLPYFNADPILDSYRNDSRFVEMQRKMGLPQ
jgi:TolB-like protein/Flp pilus assembly protein TadD